MQLYTNNVIPFTPNKTIKIKTDSLYKSNGIRKPTAADPLASMTEEGKLVVDNEMTSRFKNALLSRRYGFRDYLMFMLQYTTGRRISDIVKLNFGDVYDIERNTVKNSFEVYEKKTKKYKKLLIHPSAAEAIELYIAFIRENRININNDTPLFISQVQHKTDAKHSSVIGRINERSAYRIYREAAEACGITRDICHISTHTPRKTMAVGFFNKTGSMAGVSRLLNHSNEEVSRVYCGVTDAQINYTLLDMSF